MEKEEGEGGPSVRNIQTYNAPGPRRYIGINLWGLRGGRPARLYIRSDRVEYLALLCPVHISALPPLCLYHPPSRRPSLAVAARRCSFLRLRFARFCLGTKLRLARYECHRVLRRTRTIIFRDWRMPTSKRAPLRAHCAQCATSEKRSELVSAYFTAD